MADDYSIIPGFVGLRRNDRCPCGSGLKFKHCWALAPRGVHPADLRLRLASEDGSDLGHPQCALGGLGACRGRISLEHSVSQAVQRRLEAAAARYFAALGMPVDSRDKILIEGARTLCEFHNTELGALDGIADCVARVICEIGCRIAGAGPSDCPAVQVINGHDLERYLLKMLIGVVWSGSAGIGEWSIRKREAPPPLWVLDALVGRTRLHRPNGLYVVSSMEPNGGPSYHRAPDVGFRALFENRSGQIAGIKFRLFGADFILWASGVGSLPRLDLGQICYRPVTIDRIDDPNCPKLLMTWDTHDNMRVTYRRGPGWPAPEPVAQDPTWSNSGIYNRLLEHEARSRAKATARRDSKGDPPSR